MTRGIRWTLTLLLMTALGCLLATAQTAPTPQSQRPQPMLVPQVGHGADIQCVVFSPDGATLATGSLDTTARLWDARTGELRAILDGHMNGVWRLVFSPDSRTVATGGGDFKIRFWDARTGQLKRTTPWVPPFPDPMGGMAFSSDGRTLFSGTLILGAEDAMLAAWDAQTGQLQSKVALKAAGEAGRVLAVSPNGSIVATVARDGTIRLWDGHSGELKAPLQAQGSTPRLLAFSWHGDTLVTGDNDGTVQWFDAHSGLLQATGKGANYLVLALAVSPDGKTVAVGDVDGVRLFGSRDGKLEMKGTLPGPLSMRELARFDPSAARAYALAFSPDGETLATGNSDHATRLWDVTSRQVRTRTLPGQRQVVRLAVSPDAKTVASATFFTTALWDLTTGQLRRTVAGGVAAAFSPDGGTLATEGIGGTVRLWDTQTGQLKQSLKTPLEEQKAYLSALTFSPDGGMLACGSGLRMYRSGEVALWDLGMGQLKHSLGGHKSNIIALAFSADGRTLASGGGLGDTTVRLWDVGTGQLKVALEQKGEDQVGAIAFSPNGGIVATGTYVAGVRLWDAQTGEMKQTAYMQQAMPAVATALAFSADGRTLAGRVSSGKVLLWDVATGKEGRLPPVSELGRFAPNIAHPLTAYAGAAVSLHDPRDGRTLATFASMSVAESEFGAAVQSASGGKEGDVAANEWFVTTPEGYFDCSANAAKFIKWNVNGTLYPAERYMKRFRRPDLVRKALAGERINAPEMTADDIPPSAGFVGLKDGDAAPGDAMTVTVEARDDRDVKQVEVLVNGRPLPPDQARPIDLGARPIDLGARDVDPNHRMSKRLTFRIPLPKGAEEIRLRAVAYDNSDLGSDPVEIVLRRAEAKPVAGSLYVLSVGVSRYTNSADEGSGVRDRRIKNLQFPAIDAKAIAERFQREGKPLYEKVEARTLTDEQATAKNVREGLKWLQSSVRPGQIDTVVIFLSGHGVSVDGRYYFATHEIDLKNIQGTTLPGKELREALGGRLRAKAVFLFVDTCHSGGLTGRNDDLAIEVGEGVYLLASSGAKEYSYESKEWGHGAFTLALLRSLAKKELARDGTIYFNALTYAVPDEVAALMKEAGRNEAEQEPCIPLAARRLRVPIAQAGP